MQIKTNTILSITTSTIALVDPYQSDLFFPLVGGRVINGKTCSGLMIQGPIHMLSCLALVRVCVSSIAGIDADTL